MKSSLLNLVFVCIALAFGGALTLYAFGAKDAQQPAQGAAEGGLISAAKAAELMADTEPFVLIDVRTAQEFNQQRIPGARLLPYTEISADSAAALIPAKDSRILLYCRSGRRSAIAASALRDLGYTRVYDFGGIGDWRGETVSGPLER